MAWAIGGTIMRQNYITFAAMMAFLLAGCTLTLPVRGVVERTGDRFTGEATGYLDGAGDLHIKFADGRTCSGTFVYVNRRQGEGTFECTDNTTGPFSFVSTGMRGTGSGTLGGERFTFTFGS